MYIIKDTSSIALSIVLFKGCLEYGVFKIGFCIMLELVTDGVEIFIANSSLVFQKSKEPICLCKARCPALQHPDPMLLNEIKGPLAA